MKSKADKAEAVFEAMVSDGPCHLCGNPGRAWRWENAGDENAGDLGRHGSMDYFYCRRCIPKSINPQWTVCDDDVIRPILIVGDVGVQGTL